MRSREQGRSGFPWLELFLVIAVLSLVLQLFPTLWRGTVGALDLRNWSRSVWIAANVILLLMLVAIRYLPTMILDWRERRVRKTASQAVLEKQKKMKDQREQIERLRQARKRRIY